MSKSPVMAVRPKRGPPVFVCRKCLKRADNGAALKRALTSAFKRAGDDAMAAPGDDAASLKTAAKRAKAARKKSRPRIVMTSCFGLCPKNAVVLASAATLARGELMFLTDSAGADAAARTLLAR